MTAVFIHSEFVYFHIIDILGFCSFFDGYQIESDVRVQYFFSAVTNQKNSNTSISNSSVIELIMIPTKSLSEIKLLFGASPWKTIEKILK